MQGLVNQAIKQLVFRQTELRIHLEAMSAAGGVRALRRGDIDLLVGPGKYIEGRGSFCL